MRQPMQHVTLSARRGVWLAIAFAAIAIAAIAGTAGAASSGLRPDRTFGGGRGFVTTPIARTSALAYGAIALSGGRIVIAGQASPPNGNGQVVVARYLASGRLDRSFASGGVFQSTFPVAGAPFIANAVALDRRTGKLVIGGGYGQGSMLVIRLTANGRLDRTFGSRRNGFATAPTGGAASSLAIQTDGRILLGGSNANNPGRPFVVARFTRDGLLDRTFGRRGITQALFWNPSAGAGAALSSLVPTADGGVIAAGHIDYIGAHGAHGAAGVFRLTRKGQPFTGFGTRGHVLVTFSNRARVLQPWYPCAMSVDGRSRITVTGGGGDPVRSSLLTARLTRRGALDRSYGSAHDGRTTTPGIGGNAITTCGVALTRAGLLTVGVESKLTQILPNGRPDTRFAPRGVYPIARPKQVFINALVRSGARGLLVAGSAGNSIYIARYLLPAQP
jgi:uncharacterized delta-60 repeat protein